MKKGFFVPMRLSSGITAHDFLESARGDFDLTVDDPANFPEYAQVGDGGFLPADMGIRRYFFPHEGRYRMRVRGYVVLDADGEPTGSRIEIG